MKLSSRCRAPFAWAAMLLAEAACVSFPMGARSALPTPSPGPVGSGAGSSDLGVSTVKLPLSSTVPPADVIEQISWVGAGGNPGSGCSNRVYADGETIILGYFSTEQVLRVDVYSPTGAFPGGAGQYNFLTEIRGKTDNRGDLRIRVDRDATQFKFIVLDGQGASISQSCGIVDKHKIANLMGCPGDLNSRLAVGMEAQVSAFGPVALQVEPDKSPNEQIENLAPATKLRISSGPQCNQNMVWWMVAAEVGGGVDGGWVAEGDQDSWFIEPIN